MALGFITHQILMIYSNNDRTAHCIQYVDEHRAHETTDAQAPRYFSIPHLSIYGHLSAPPSLATEYAEHNTLGKHENIIQSLYRGMYRGTDTSRFSVHTPQALGTVYRVPKVTAIR